MYSEIEKLVNECVLTCRKYNLFDYVVLISNDYLVFVNTELKQYLCFKHSFEMDLIQYLLNCGNALYVLNTEKIYYFSTEYIKSEFLIKFESVVH